MDVTWFGHSCFYLVGSDGRSLVIDPYDSATGYGIPPVSPDVLLISHNHHDHNNVRAIGGDPVVVKGHGTHRAAGIEFRGVLTYHDDKGGRLRGTNTVFCFTMDGISVAHLGDLGHILTRQQVSEIGPVDLIFIPVGGIFTIDAASAVTVAEQLRAKVVVPMHYLTDSLSFELDPVDRFLKGRVVEGPVDRLHLEQKGLEPARTVVMRYLSG